MKPSAATPLPGHRAPAVGFEAPLEMLSACHGRIDDQCALLQRLLTHVRSHGVDSQACDAALAVIRYFDTAAVLHHADEEQNLFPALLESMAASDPVCLRQLTQDLATQHRELEARWRRVRASLQRLVDQRDAAALDGDDIDRLVTGYKSHIETEERELLPMAARLLGTAQLDEVGRAMRERRGVVLP
ncbi:MAG: hemerythrin domain-containing protein [Rubrivivax sp.]